MLRDFLDGLVKLSREASNVAITKVEGVRDRVWLRKPDNSVEEVALDPPARTAKLRSLADFVAYLLGESRAKSPEVYHGHGAIVALLDSEDRRDRVEFVPLLTDVATKLVGLAREDYVANPKDAIRFMRDLGVSTTTIALFRRLDFERKSSGSRTVEHGRESLGRSVEAKVQGTDKIPETIGVSCRMFCNSGIDFSTTIQVDIEVDLEQEKIGLSVRKDEMQTAIDFVQSKIGAVLRERLGENIEVFHGVP